ncbi:MFS transporter [Kribbella sp. NPDC049227]|uniref:MFS transporter n=1 Tax=Kribbella sp. NPDC049227 TaxID=3364113 RepID=UPI003715387B
MGSIRWKAVRPLRHRDYRLLWTGLAVALLGSGLWLVALAWQVIELGGGPVQLSVVTTAYSIGLVVCVLFGGIAADRLSQRSVIVAADGVRGLVLLVVAGLALTELLEVWHLATAAVLIGAGEAFLIPAYTALVPKLLPADELLAANGLEGTLRPLAQQATGPALGGLAIAAMSPGIAILITALTYFFSAGCVLAMRVPAPADEAPSDEVPQTIFGDLREGWAYVRRTRWLLASLLFGTVFVLLILGPLEVLLPFAIRDQLGGGPSDFGLVLAAFGVGGAAGALLISSRSLPRRYLTVMTLMWGVGSLPFVLLGFARVGRDGHLGHVAAAPGPGPPARTHLQPGLLRLTPADAVVDGAGRTGGCRVRTDGGVHRRWCRPGSGVTVGRVLRPDAVGRDRSPAGPSRHAGRFAQRRLIARPLGGERCRGAVRSAG